MHIRLQNSCLDDHVQWTGNQSLVVPLTCFNDGYHKMLYTLNIEIHWLHISVAQCFQCNKKRKLFQFEDEMFYTRCETF